MKLNLYLYLKKNKTTISQLSKDIGCSREHLTKIINGQKHPSTILAKAIENATGGEVKAEDLMKGQ